MGKMQFAACLERRTVGSKSKNLLWILAFAFTIAFVACGDDKGSSPEGLPDEVANMDELEEYKCDDSVIGEIVYVKSKSKNYECDGDEWSVSKNQSKSSSSAKSSSSKKSSSSTKSSSSSAKSSSSSGQSIAFKAPCNVKTDENCFEDSRDGQTYRITKIAGQIWMAENLNYKVEGSYCYNDSVEYCKKYGRLYSWAAAMDSAGVWSPNGKGCGYGNTCVAVYPVRGICPEGWHLPKYKEFRILLDSAIWPAALHLKSTSGWNDYKGQSGNGSDDFGFSALPAGMRKDETYSSVGIYADFWSSSGRDRWYAYTLSMLYFDSTASLNYHDNEKIALSVRCINDKSDSVNFVPPCRTDDKDDCVYGSLTDDRDGQTYKTVKIGDQWWMAVNLNYETERSYWISNSGSFSNQKISELKDIDTSKYKYPVTKFGRYYLWSEAMDSAGVWSSNGKGCGYGDTCVPLYPVRGICPDGWHLPTITEYEILFVNVNIGGDGETGFALKSSYGWYDDGGGIDAYGFTALPVGCASRFGDFGSSAYFWSSTDSSRDNAGYIEMEHHVGNAVPQFTHKGKGFPIRCVKD